MFADKQRGFSLIELLTVIGIIAILAGIIFPIMGAVKSQARKTECMNNLNAIYTAMKLFQQDEHRYPDFIAGPVEYEDSNGNISYLSSGGTLVPLDRSDGMYRDPSSGNKSLVALYPEYIKTPNTLKCPLSTLHNLDGFGSAYTFADVRVDPMYGYWKSRSGGSKSLRGIGISVGSSSDSAPFGVYAYDNYDVQVPQNRYDPTDSTKSKPSIEAHYSPLWDYQTPAPTTAAAVRIYERQLWWRNPPENTLITWCSYHGDSDANGVPSRSSKDLVLFLDGHVKQIPTAQLEDSGASKHWDTVWQNAVD